MRRSPFSVLLAVGLLLAALVPLATRAVAEEEEALSPEERFAVRAELMAPPNETMAFAVEGEVRCTRRRPTAT